MRVESSLLLFFVVYATVYAMTEAHMTATAEPASFAPATDRALANSAVEKLSQSAISSQVEILKNVKAGTDGIQLAIQAAASHDVSKMLKGIGDSLSVLPGAFGYAGIAFSVAASVVALFGGGSVEDPVMSSLNALHSTLTEEMDGIKTALATINDRVTVVINGIDRLLSDVSALPAKIVAEMQLTDVSTMKDKLAAVQRAAEQYAKGSLSREQMIAKCDDYEVPSLFSELETIVMDEKELFEAKFGTMVKAQAMAQLQLLLFYLSVVPVASNCNALKYPLESVAIDGQRIDQVVKFAYARAVWFLTRPDRTVRIRERFNPFDTTVEVLSEPAATVLSKGEWSFPAYTFMPPRGVCMEVLGGGRRLEKRVVAVAAKVPNDSTFCVESESTDDATLRIVYAERRRGADTLAILQPERVDSFDPLATRRWTDHPLVFYTADASHWQRLPLLRVVSDLVVLQAKTSKVTVDEITTQCRSLGQGFDRDGDAHSKDYSGAPWTIFCVQYVALTLRDIVDKDASYLIGVKMVDLPSGDAWTAPCPEAGYVRDTGSVPIPSKIKKQWFGGTSSMRSYAVCLKWGPLTDNSTPQDFVSRVWFNDTQPMASKPQHAQHEGTQRMGL